MTIEVPQTGRDGTAGQATGQVTGEAAGDGPGAGPADQGAGETSHAAGEDRREVLTWAVFGDAARELAQLVVADYDVDLVIAVARGGLVPGGAVAYALGVKAVGTLNVEFYTDIATTLPDPIVLPPLLDTDALDGAKVLVVDDVADSGRTLALVLDLVRSYGAQARSAVLYAKPTSVVEPDYIWRRTSLWITFPWSAHPPVVAPARDS